MLVAAAAGLLFASRRAGVVAPGAPGWREGSVYRYQLRYTDDQTTSLLGTPVTSAVRIAGEWVVTPRGRHDGALLVGVRFARLTESRLSMQGKEVPADLTTEEVFAEIGGGGEVLAVYGAHDRLTMPLNVTRMVLGELQAHAPAPGRDVWVGRETTLHGDVEVTIAAAPSRVTKKRLRYTRLAGLPLEDVSRLGQELDHAATLELDEGGWLRRAHATERLSAAPEDGAPLFTLTSELDLELVAVEPAAPAPAPEGLARLSLGEIVTEPGLERQLADQRIDGLTWDELEAGLRLGIHPDARFMWRAGGLLTRDPSLCARLAPVFTRADATLEQRALILDLLAGVGHPGAQAAMRDLLRTPAATGDDTGYVRLVQSFSLLKEPDAETARFLAEEHHAADGERRLAAAHALGSVADGVADPDTVRDLQRTLRAGIDGARTAPERAAYVAALGNARQAEDAALFGAHAGSPDEHLDVRLAATRAIGRLDADDGVAELVELCGASQRHVQRAALHALARRPLTAEARARVAAAVADLAIAGRLELGGLPPALDLLQELPDRALRHAALAALRATAADDPQIALRLERLSSS